MSQLSFWTEPLSSAEVQQLYDGSRQMLSASALQTAVLDAAKTPSGTPATAQGGSAGSPTPTAADAATNDASPAPQPTAASDQMPSGAIDK